MRYRVNVSIAHCGQRCGRPICSIEERVEAVRLCVEHEQRGDQRVADGQTQHGQQRAPLLTQHRRDDADRFGIAQELDHTKGAEGAQQLEQPKAGAQRRQRRKDRQQVDDRPRRHRIQQEGSLTLLRPVIVR